MKYAHTIDEIREMLLPIFRANPIERAVVFGSYAKGNATPLSDVDIMIDSKGKVRGIDFFGVLDDIAEVMKRPIDLLELSQIVPGGRIQKEIEETGVVIYERT